MKKTIIVLSVFVLICLSVYLMPVPKGHAQQGGVATVVGGVTPVNQFQQSVAGALAGAVTNPASNFVINVAGGPIYFGGGIQDIAQSTLTLPASSTNLLVWNGYQQIMYSKQAVTGPGSNGTSAINGPGFPTQLLFADPTRGEIPLATVVCNATACGNGGNGTITDNRPLAAFPAGQYVGGHLNSTVAGTAAATAFQGTGTLAGGTLAVTFTQAFQSAPVCLANDTTAAAAVKTSTTTTTLTLTGTTTDTVAWACIGNPN